MATDRVELRSITSATVPDSLEWDGFEKYLTGVDPIEMGGIEHAFNTAKKLHKNHSPRDTGGPYFEHPYMVARYLAEAGIKDPSILKAALMHDGMEDHPDLITELGLTSNPGRKRGPYTLLAVHFGAEASGIVRFLSKLPPRKNSQQEKDHVEEMHQQGLLQTLGLEEELRQCSKARLIKLSDRLHNFRTLPWRDYDPVLLQVDISRAERKLVETRVGYRRIFQRAESQFPVEGGILLRHLRQDMRAMDERLKLTRN